MYAGDSVLVEELFQDEYDVQCRLVFEVDLWECPSNS